MRTIPFRTVVISIALILSLSACASKQPQEYAAEFYDQGLVWYEKQAYDRSIDSFTKALEMTPDAKDNYKIYFDRGKAYSKNRDYEHAIYDFTKSIEMAPKTDKELLFSAYHERGNCWQAKGEFSNAIADYNNALSSNPRDDDAKYLYQSLGWAWLGVHDYDKSIANFSTALGVDTKLPNSYYGRGLAWYYKGDYSQSLIDAKEAVDLSPNNKAYDDLVYKAGSAMKGKQP
jgi:tetratricopeptide (TPR) repeat protein